MDVESENSDNEHVMEESSDDHDRSKLRWILTLFFRMVYHFRISKNAISAILSFFSFVLGML